MSALLAIVTLSAAVAVQQDSATLRATIRGWSNEMWLRALDRSAAYGGRLNARGTLQRFHPEIDAEYELDLISAGLGLSEEYAWQQRESGARFWTGSINYERLIAGATLKAAVPLGHRWTARLEFDHADLPVLYRNRLQMQFRKDWGRAYGFVEGSLLAYKPENDLTIGAGWKDAKGDATISFTLADAFTDIVYQVLKVYSGFADTALDYERQPLALRGSLNRTLGARVRVEADAGVFLPSRVRAYRQLSVDEGFRQDERFAMAAGLIEWSISPTVRTGVFGRYVRARTDRTPLPLDTLLSDYLLVERTSSAGVFLLAQPSRRWHIEAWTARVVRPETRDYRPAGVADVDYEDRTWTGQTLVGYQAPRGFKLIGTLEWDLRDVTRGDSLVPAVETLARHNTRVRLELGWRLPHFDVTLGYRTDLDRDQYQGIQKWFDGAHGRFAMQW